MDDRRTMLFITEDVLERESVEGRGGTGGVGLYMENGEEQENPINVRLNPILLYVNNVTNYYDRC